MQVKSKKMQVWAKQVFLQWNAFFGVNGELQDKNIHTHNATEAEI